MVCKVLIVDDNERFRNKLERFILSDWQDAEVVIHDPLVQGWPNNDIDWSSYDILFLNHLLNDIDAIDWLTEHKSRSITPATIITSAQSDPELAVRAIKAGAENYLSKNALTHNKLTDIIQDVLDNPNVSSTSSTQGSVNHVQAANQSPVPRKKSVVASQKDEGPPLPDVEGYRLLKKVGQGGMSNIYLAERESDNVKIAIKMLLVNLAENQKLILRSIQEYKLISRINNPHIVKLYDHGTLDDLMYTVMEYYPGGDLKQRLRAGITQQDALRYLLQISSGLSAIHGSGIIHRDLKPGNIMFDEQDNIAIIDFGIAKDINTKLDLTNSGQVMGTPNYMAPEQGNGGYRPDARSDIYSLGVLLYEMLTGKKPYAAPTSAAIIYKHLHDPVPTLPNQFYEMQSLIDVMMAKFPQHRFQSAIDLTEYINKEFRWDITLDFD